MVVKREEDWVRVPDAFEAIISREDFDTVQMLLGMDTRVAPDKSEVYLLSSIDVCGDCGRRCPGKYLRWQERDMRTICVPIISGRGNLIVSAKVMGEDRLESHGNIRMFMKRFWVKCRDSMV